LITLLVRNNFLKPFYTTTTDRFGFGNKTALVTQSLGVLRHGHPEVRSLKGHLLCGSLQSTAASANPVFMLLL